MELPLKETFKNGRTITEHVQKNSASLAVLHDCRYRNGVVTEPPELFLGETTLLVGSKMFSTGGNFYAIGYNVTATAIQILKLSTEEEVLATETLFSDVVTTDGRMSFARFEKGVLFTRCETGDMWWAPKEMDLTATPAVPPIYLGLVASFVGNFRERLVLACLAPTAADALSAALLADQMAAEVDQGDGYDGVIPADWTLLENPLRTVMWGGWLEDILNCLLNPTQENLTQLVRSHDWGWKKVPYTITGLHCMYNSIVLTSLRIVWRMTPLTEFPSFAFAPITNFGAMCSGSNAATTAFMAVDGRTYLLMDDGSLKQLSDRNDGEYGAAVVLSEQTGDIYWCGATGTLVYTTDSWYTRSEIVHAYAHRIGLDVMLGITHSFVPAITTEVMNLGTPLLKNIRSIRIIGTGVTGIRVHYTQDSQGLWGRTATIIPDNTGTCLVGLSCMDLRLEIDCTNPVIDDVIIDYDITPKANFGRISRRI